MQIEDSIFVQLMREPANAEFWVVVGAGLEAVLVALVDVDSRVVLIADWVIVFVSEAVSASEVGVFIDVGLSASVLPLVIGVDVLVLVEELEVTDSVDEDEDAELDPPPIIWVIANVGLVFPESPKTARGRE